jgi:hypothetical protein
MNDSSVFTAHIKNIDLSTREINFLQKSFGQKLSGKLNKARKTSSTYKIVLVNFEPEKHKEEIIKIDRRPIQQVVIADSPEVTNIGFDKITRKEEKAELVSDIPSVNENSFIHRLVFISFGKSIFFSKLADNKIFSFVRKLKLVGNFWRH